MDWQERSRLLVGDDNMEKLNQAHVILFGLGGVGSFVAEALVRSGLGNLSLVEYDRVTESNRNRQIPALCSTVGMAKIEATGARLLDINPNLHLFQYPMKMTAENLEAILEGEAGLPAMIADAIDDLPAKASLIISAKKKGIPIISCMGAGYRLDPSRLRIGDISETHTCPLARKLRRNLREAEIDKGVPVVWSDEIPAAAYAKPVPDSEDTADRDDTADREDTAGDASHAGPASMIFVPAAAGLLMASYIIRQLIL